jgi:hypothetical protein
MKLQQNHVSGLGMIKYCSVILPALVLTLLLTTTGFAEDNGEGLGGDDFRKTAMDYENRASKYEDKGMSDIASIYARKAEIKRHAGTLADQGKWDDIDWSEYEALDAKLMKLYKSKKHKK